MAKPIGTLGVIQTLTIDGYVFTDVSSNLITLHGWSNSNQRCTYRKAGGSSGYQVTSGKTYTINACKLQPDQSASATQSACGFVLAQVDADIGIDSGTAFTNAVYLTGAATAFHIIANTVTGSQVVPQGGLSFGIAATKYVGHLSIATNGTIGATWGYEA